MSNIDVQMKRSSASESESLRVSPNVLDVSTLRVGYGARAVLHDIQFAIGRGEWCALLGPNGVGKSTLLHAITGRIRPMSGSIRVEGHSVTNELATALRHIGVACAPETLPALLTGRQCLEVYAAAKELQHVDPEILELGAALKCTQYLDSYVDTYSLGTRQKLSILLALLGKPSLIIFDEAFNGLDPASSLLLKKHLRAEVSAGRCSVLLATHALDIVEHFADTAVLLFNGKIARSWNRDELKQIRESREQSFESQLAAAVE